MKDRVIPCCLYEIVISFSGLLYVSCCISRNAPPHKTARLWGSPTNCFAYHRNGNADPCPNLLPSPTSNPTIIITNLQDDHPDVNGVTSPSLSNTTTLTVHVRNENDQNPEFTHSLYTATLAQDAPVVRACSSKRSLQVIDNHDEHVFDLCLGVDCCVPTSHLGIRQRFNLTRSCVFIRSNKRRLELLFGRRKNCTD